DGVTTWFKIAIIGPSEAFVQELVTVLSSFEWNFRNVAVSVVGTFRDQNLKSLIPIIKEAERSKTIPIVIGFDDQTLKSVFDGFQFLERLFSLCCVQDIAGTTDDLTPNLLELRDPYFYHMSLLGSQSHLMSQSFSETANGLDQLRLGKLRTDISIAEPQIRNADILSMDLNALKYGDAPMQSRPSSVGLLSEEACQLTYYAGRSERNKLFCLYGIDTDHKVGTMEMGTLAALIWYYIHGLEFRRDTYPPDLSGMTLFTVEPIDEGTQFLFYKDEAQQKWWLKVPVSAGNTLATIFPLIACGYSDYATLVNEQTPTDYIISMLELYHSFDAVNKSSN
ncbi:MAG: hypothetical protein OEQ53_22400, partial [Saprospiraceae bacterium]|nr:hypothetical protein [Saprospiraceae bacterium]